MALSNEQLLMLDNLIYTDYCNNGDTVAHIIEKMTDDMNRGKTIDGCEMTNDEWYSIIKAIEDEPVLLDYSVQNFKEDATGTRAACFVNNVENPTDVNVVFRGTSGDYEWHDNGEGGYSSDTGQQKAAAEYVNNLPQEYGNKMTVTGHSKGGNKAQYVTIATDRIAKCVSYDGQGFSEEFLEKYKDEIARKSKKIVSISASNDFVNCLLYPIAGTQIYLETQKQKDYKFYHKPNILLDNNGNLRPETEQSDISKFINGYTTYMISNLKEPERSITVDGLIALLESGDDKETIFQTIYAGETAISHLDDFAFNYIGETYGVPAELISTYFASVVCPFLFLDDLVNCGEEIFYEKIKNFADEVGKKLEELGKKASEFAVEFIRAITKVNNDYLYVNTDKLATDAATVKILIDRIIKKIDEMYQDVNGLNGMWTGTANNAFRAKFSKEHSEIKKYLNDFKDYSNKLTEDSNEYNNCENYAIHMANAIRI